MPHGSGLGEHSTTTARARGAANGFLPGPSLPLPGISTPQLVGADQVAMIDPMPGGVALNRMSTADAIETAQEMSRTTFEQEEEMNQEERAQLEAALVESRKQVYMSADERMAEEASFEAHEPELKRPEDLEKWTRWAKAYADMHTRYTHPRAYSDSYKPTSRRLPLCTSAREIGRQFGAGVQLYLDLMSLYLLTCLLAGGLHAYSTYLNVRSRGTAVWEADGARAFVQKLPMLLLLTTNGARLDCTDYDCRLATTITALLDVLVTLIVLVRLPRRMREYVGRVAHRVDHARVTVADYSLELKGLPPQATVEHVHKLVHKKLEAHARARLRALEPRQSRLKRLLGGSRLAALGRSLSMKKVTHAELELVTTAAAQVRRFVSEERWCVALDGVVLNLHNGALLTRAQRKVPLLKKIETHSKIDQRIRAVRGAPPAWWQLGERYGDWSRARRIEKFKATLNGVSNALLNSPELTEARATHSAFVTFEWEEGRLEALHAFQKDWWQCGAGHVVAHAVGEPADLYHHDLEHRGSWGNVARRAAALCALTLVLGCAFAVLFANTKLDDILLTNATSSLCNGLSIAIDSAVEGATDFVTQGAEGGEAASGDAWAAAAAEAAVQAGSGSGDAGGAEGEAEAEASEFCVQVSDLAGRFLPVLVAPMVNNVLYVVVDILARKERPASFTELTYTKASE